MKNVLRKLRPIKKPPTVAQAKTALLIYYSAPLRVVFKKFRDGLIYFAVGMMTIIMVNQYMESSLQRDLIALAGLVLTIIGFFMAITAHMRLIIGRIIQFFRKK